METITPTTLDQIIKIHGRGWLKNSDKPNAQISKNMLDIYKKTESYKSDPEVLKAAPKTSLKAQVEEKITDSKPKKQFPKDTPSQSKKIKRKK